MNDYIIEIMKKHFEIECDRCKNIIGFYDGGTIDYVFCMSCLYDQYLENKENKK